MNNTNSFQEIIISTLNSVHSVGSEIYEKGKELGGKAIDNLQEQIPDVINQLMTYEFFYHLFWAIIPIIILLVILALAFYGAKFTGLEKNEINGIRIVVGLFWIFFSCMVVFSPGGDTSHGAFNNMMTCIKIKTAPKIFLIEYVNGLVKGENKHNH